jgi:hypothetical protein
MNLADSDVAVHLALTTQPAIPVGLDYSVK